MYCVTLRNLGNALLLTAVVLLWGCAKEQPVTQQKKYAIQVSTSSYVPYTLASQILDGVADVAMIMQPAQEPHHFEPSPTDVVTAQKADFLFFTSKKLEPWAFKINPLNSKSLADAAQNINPKDPHIWMDFNNTAAMGDAIATAVATEYPWTEGALLRNTLNFQNEMEMLKRLYAKALENCESRKVFHIGHNAFGYIANNYKLEFIPLSGATFEAEPSAKELAEMIKQIKQNNIKYIFTEDAVNTKLAATIATETGAKTIKLYTVEFVTKDEFAAKTSYRQFMTKNLQALTEGLGCK